MLYSGVVIVFISYLTLVLRAGFQKGVRQVHGPFIARFSGLYRLWLVYAAKVPFEYRKVHRNYGPLVRVGPNHISISDPGAIPQIYHWDRLCESSYNRSIDQESKLTYQQTQFYDVFIPFYKTNRCRVCSQF